MIRRFAETDDPSSFSCGNTELDWYLKHHALANASLGVGVTYVNLGATGAVDGFVTLAGCAVRGAEVGLGNLPRFPLPVLLLARLAVDSGVQGRGVGTRLLRFAFEEAVLAYGHTGCVGVLVDAKPSAVGFYERLGFEQVAEVDKVSQARMFLEIGAVLDALGYNCRTD